MSPRRSSMIRGPFTGASSEPLDDHRDTLPDPDAHGAQRPPAAAALELIERRGREARAARAERMTQGDGSALPVHVRGIVRDAELAQHGERLRRKRLVQLDEVDVGEREAEAREQLPGG